jgi:hypothetical protein
MDDRAGQVLMSGPDLDAWLADPSLRVGHQRASRVDPDALWAAALQVRLADTGVLGRLIRWRIPGLARDVRYDALFREPPFLVLEEGERALVSGLVGSIWTLRRDYPRLQGPDEFRAWSHGGTAQVVFANWVAGDGNGGSVVHSEARVTGFGVQGRVGVAAVRPLVRRFQGLVGSEGLRAAVRRAEQGT